MALRGADVDPALVRSGSVGVYLNQFYRTRAWVGTDERAYAPGDRVTGTAYLKHNPHPSRRDLVLSQVDVYLSPECARRKRNFTYDTRAHTAKRQNLADFYYLRRPGPVGSGTYRTYYDYGDTIPPRDSPFRGPFQSPYHWRAHRFLGPDAEPEAPPGEESEESSSGTLGLNTGLSAPPGAASGALAPGAAPPERDGPEPALIRHSVFKAARDGGPRALPEAHSETAFRFAVRVPADAPESYAWAEPKDGCVIEVRYRLFVVFKLRAAPRNAVNAVDPLFWAGAHRLGESPMVVLFAENLVHVDSPRGAGVGAPLAPRPHAYDIAAGVPRLPAQRARVRARSLLGRRWMTLHVPDGPCAIGTPVRVRVVFRCRGMERGLVDLRVEFIERVVLRQGRRFTASAAVRALALQREVDKDGLCAADVELRTDFGDVYPSAFLAGLSVAHHVRVVLWPSERFSLSARAPVTMVAGPGQFITRAVHNETLYPARARQPPWRRERSRRIERERAKRESVAAVVDALPEAVVTVECGSDEEEEVCAICLDEITAKRAVLLPCSHMLHDECIKGWLAKDVAGNCPVCRNHVMGSASNAGSAAAVAAAAATRAGTAPAA